jgi:DNA polymerase I-like protein with 3'-5' exonuclease and polymerase domains
VTTEMPRPVCIDFETMPIRDRPIYPPEPVGVSIKEWGKPAVYYAWGHVDGTDTIKKEYNNTTRLEAERALRRAYKNRGGLLFMNAKFDLEVALEKFGLALPPWQRVHDLMFLIFLHNPNEKTIGLKETAGRLLGQPPAERDAVADWLLKHQPLDERKIKIGRAAKGKEPPGKYMAYAPCEVVGPYANGDTERTAALFAKLWPDIQERGMGAAYDREREFMFCILDMERRGIRVDTERLGRDVEDFTVVQAKVEAWIRARLGVKDKDFNLDSAATLLAALVKAEKADTKAMGLTPTGRVCTNKAAMAAGVADLELRAMLEYRSRLKTCLSTFMRPWRDTALVNGCIYTTWNQVKQEGAGARTGRMSSSNPVNFQNMPKEFQPLFRHEKTKDMKKAEIDRLVPCPVRGLPRLPLCRGYIIPYRDGDVLCDRDYCFSPDTEVLTEDRGFVRFDALTFDTKLAQWGAGEITFALPLSYQKVLFEGDLVRVIGDRSVDLLVTPNHNCLLLDEKRRPVFVKAKNYPLGHHRQMHAGIALGGGEVNPWLMRFVVALQADATVKAGGDRLVWKLKKLRKRERLRDIFAALGLAYLEVPVRDQVVITTRASMVPGLGAFILLAGKTFKAEALRRVDAAGRKAFLTELAFWDGRRNTPNSWAYFSTNLANVDTACELAAITGMRANMRTEVLKSGKSFSTVNIRLNAATLTDTFRIKHVPYKGLTYCVTMPHSTVVVRRNGKVMVTGQSQQEPRILAYFEAGDMEEQYKDDPWIDFHDNAQAKLEVALRRKLRRKDVKTLNLGIIYGMGLRFLASKNSETIEATRALRDALLALYPGLKYLTDLMKERKQKGEPIRTWGGRVYFAEPDLEIMGYNQDFDTEEVVDRIDFTYKMVNTLIQGSAADCTKEAVIRYYRTKPAHHFLILQVHDQLIASAPRAEMAECHEMMRLAMEGVDFGDIKMLTEGEWSETNWNDMKTYDKKGQPVALKEAA